MSELEASAIPVGRVTWRPAYRIVPSRYPPVGLFDRVASPADLDEVMAIEGLTNDRLRLEAGDINLVPKGERVSGPGTTPIMAAFTHINPNGSRFSDGTYGVYYAGATEKTAIIETRYHRERFMRYSHEKPMRLEMRVYLSDIDEDFHDIRGMAHRHPEWYNKSSYASSQKLGARLKQNNSNGIVYDSVRDPDGQCIGVFKPTALRPVRQGSHYEYVWDGNEITDVLKVKRVL